MPKNRRTKCYGAWRDYEGAYLQSVAGGEGWIPRAICQRMLATTGFTSVDSFNSELNRHARGEIPKNLQKRLRRLFDGHGWVMKAFYTDYIAVSVKGDYGKDGGRSLAGEIDNPLMLCEDPSPAEIEIYAMGIKRGKGGYAFWFHARIAAKRLFKPKPGEEDICALLIEPHDSFDELKAADKRTFATWINQSGLQVVSLQDAFDDARDGIKYSIEAMGIGPSSFGKELNGEAVYGYDVEYANTTDEIGFSVSS